MNIVFAFFFFLFCFFPTMMVLLLFPSLVSVSHITTRLRLLVLLLNTIIHSQAYQYRNIIRRVRFSQYNYRLRMTNRDPLDSLGLPTPLLLGSASFTRKLILKEMGVPFHILVRPIDEKNLGDRSKDPPDELALTLARAKMNHLVQEIQAGRCDHELPSQTKDSIEWIVLTGDQVVTCN